MSVAFVLIQTDLWYYVVILEINGKFDYCSYKSGMEFDINM